jgi:hypothetical protein
LEEAQMETYSEMWKIPYGPLNDFLKDPAGSNPEKIIDERVVPFITTIRGD